MNFTKIVGFFWHRGSIHYLLFTIYIGDLQRISVYLTGEVYLKIYLRESELYALAGIVT